MDVANKIKAKLKKILKKLKSLGIIQAFKLEINFCQVEGNFRNSLVEIDSVLRKCLRKIINKPRKAEIRNVISELVRRKNLSDIVIAKEPIQRNLLDQKLFFIRHTDDIAALPLRFQCDYCKEILNSKARFLNHKKSHAKYLCDKCGLLFYSFQKWDEHLKLSHSIRNFTDHLEDELSVFDNCNLNAVPEDQSKNNINSENPLIQTFENQIKAKVKKSQPDYASENVQKKFICSCGKTFQILKTLRKHEKLKHSLQNIKRDCVICGKSFLERGKLNRHMLSHKDSQYSCSFCSKEFSRSDTLKRHMRLFHNTPNEFDCSFCEKKFKLKFNRDIHEENIHKNVNSQVQCHQCGRKLKNKVTLKGHIETHSEKKITCVACCKSFSRNSYYRNHLKRKHFGVIPQQKIPDEVSI